MAVAKMVAKRKIANDASRLPVTNYQASSIAADAPEQDDSFEGFSSESEEERPEDRQARIKKIKTHHVKSKEQFLGGTYVGEVYKSNLFKLQVDELLVSLRPKLSRIEQSVTAQLHALKSIIEDIPDEEPISISNAEKQMSKIERIVIPFSEPRPKVDSNYKLQFLKPTNINLAGSYPLKIITKDHNAFTLDLIVTMSKDMFQEKDYLNHRYFAKRAYFLANIAAAIKKSQKQRASLKFELLHGNEFLPALVVESQPLGDKIISSAHNVRVRILPVLPKGVFNDSKLFPTKSCIRSKTASEGDPCPTPFYNASILQDSLIPSYLAFQNNAIQECEPFRDACLLGRVWLRQRGFGSSQAKGGFGNFEWSTLMGLLLSGGGPKGAPLFSNGYSSYQLFKATLQYLTSKDPANSPQLIGTSMKVPSLKGFNVPMIYDGMRNHNVLFKMTPWSFKLLHWEAQITLSTLGDDNADHFESIFITRNDLSLCRYDAVIEFPADALLATDTRVENGQLQSSDARIAHLHKTLTTALMARAIIIAIHPPESGSWPADHKPGKSWLRGNVLVGFVFDGSQIDRAVDHGPSAEMAAEAAQFRKFWGEKAELRRFRDGSIMESLVWNTESSKHTIFRQIISYITKRHYGEVFEQRIRYVEIQSMTVAGATAPTDSTSFHPVIESFKNLEKTVRDFDNLPLRVSQLLPADSQLSSSSTTVPFVPGKSQMVRPAEAILQFEASTRWPDDIDAIQRTKIAFLIKLGESLEEVSSDMKCQIGQEYDDQPLLNQGFLDVVYSSGASFRLRIQHDREAVLLETKLKGKSIEPQEKLLVAGALAICKQRFVQAPVHCQAMQALGIRYSALAPAVRLVKNWFSAHLLSSYFAEQVIELFVARAFTNPSPWSAPSSTSTAFLRTLLFLSRWDWKNEPWIANLGGEPIPEAEISAISTRLEAWRKIDPALNRVVLFVASNFDGDGTTWTGRCQPPKVVAGRMSALAKAATESIKTQGTKLEIESLFVSNLADYDFVIHVDPYALRNSNKAPANGFKNIELQENMDMGLVGYDPFRQYVDELQELYSNVVVFFYNRDKRDKIAGLWNPQTKRSWKLKLGYSSILTDKAGLGDSSENGEGSSEVEANRDAILNEIARLGGKLVSKITTK